jgi:hypothetical protein
MSAGGAPVTAMSGPIKLTFNRFSIEGALLAVDPLLTEAEIATAYDAFVARGTLGPNPSPPLSRVEQMIFDVLSRQAAALAREQHEAVSKISSPAAGRL